MFNATKLKGRTLWIVLLILMSGCDEEAVRIAREAADRQARQNTTMAELNKEVAGGTHQLVEADAEARKAIVGVHHDLQTERSRLDSGWNALEIERRQIAGQRRTDSMLVPVGGVLLLVVLLGFCWAALAATRGSGNAAGELNELLITEILPDEKPLDASHQNLATLLSHTQLDTQHND